jgi:hypothetical protein
MQLRGSPSARDNKEKVRAKKKLIAVAWLSMEIDESDLVYW